MIDLDPMRDPDESTEDYLRRLRDHRARDRSDPALVAEERLALLRVARAAEQFHEINYRYRNPFPIAEDRVTVEQYDEASQELVNALRAAGMPQPPDLEGDDAQ